MRPERGKPRFFLEVFDSSVDHEPQEPRSASSQRVRRPMDSPTWNTQFDRRNEHLMAKKAASSKAATKADIYTNLSEKTGLSKKEIGSVFDALGDLIGKE